jgi:hypothetical protein
MKLRHSFAKDDAVIMNSIVRTLFSDKFSNIIDFSTKDSRSTDLQLAEELLHIMMHANLTQFEVKGSP